MPHPSPQPTVGVLLLVADVLAVDAVLEVLLEHLAGSLLPHDLLLEILTGIPERFLGIVAFLLIGLNSVVLLLLQLRLVDLAFVVTAEPRAVELLDVL